MGSEAVESTLLRMTARGDMGALGELYERYSGIVYSAALRLTNSSDEAEDIVHDVFIKLPSTLPTFKGLGSFESWLRRVAVRTTLMRLRQLRREQSLAEVLESRDSPLRRSSDPVDRVMLTRAIQALPADQRTVFLLHEIDGYTHQEIGELLGITWQASGVRLFRARRRLCALLGRP